jgi:predicted  nucleic acid-binding Zn-ribbon protein
MTRGAPLYQLQKLDQELGSGLRRVSEIQDSLGETEALRQARRALVEAEENHRSWMTDSRDLELEIETLDSKIASCEKRLYGGSVTNPKELSDMQNEIASLRRRLGELEDQMLEAMVHSDEAEATEQEQRRILAETEQDWHAQQSALTSELNDLETRLVQVREEREQARQTIATEDLDLYDKLCTRYGAIVVARLIDGVCDYCSVAPSSTKLSRLRSGRELLQCGNCGRILLDL